MGSARTRRGTSTAMLVLAALAVVAGPVAAQSSLQVCVEVTNDADRNGTFTDLETAAGTNDVVHRVELDDCGDWDVVVASVVATADGADTAVCEELAGTEVRVDEVVTCEFTLPAPDEERTVDVVVTVRDANGELGATQASDDTMVRPDNALGPAPAPTTETATITTDPSPTATTPTAEPTSTPTDEPTADPTPAPTPTGTAEAVDTSDTQLADTGTASWSLLAWSLVLVLGGLVLVDAGRRVHVLQPVYGVHARRRGVRNPVLGAAMVVTRQVRWRRLDTNAARQVRDVGVGAALSRQARWLWRDLTR